jgi:hypothetical protein
LVSLRGFTKSSVTAGQSRELPGNGEILEVGAGLHCCDPAFPVTEARVLDAADGRFFDAVTGAISGCNEFTLRE